MYIKHKYTSWEIGAYIDGLDGDFTKHYFMTKVFRLWMEWKMERNRGDNVLFKKMDFPAFKDNKKFADTIKELEELGYLNIVKRPRGRDPYYEATLITDKFITKK